MKFLSKPVTLKEGETVLVKYVIKKHFETSQYDFAEAAKPLEKDIKVKFIKAHIKLIVWIFLPLWIASTIIFGDFSGMSDGLTKLGFPLVFLQDTGGKCHDCDAVKWFKLSHMLIDMVLHLAFAVIVIRLIKRGA